MINGNGYCRRFPEQRMTREETLKGAPLKFTEMFHPIYSRELIGRIGNT